MIGIIILVYILVVVLSRWQKAIWVRCQATRLALWLALDLGSIRNKLMVTWCPIFLLFLRAHEKGTYR